MQLPISQPPEPSDVVPPAVPAFEDVRAAAGCIAPHVHRTPVLTSRTVDAELGARVFFKCENFQKTGAFKARGAVNAVSRLAPDAAARGVITHSSGNHAAALAYAAGIRGIPCTAVIPENAPEVKVRAARAYGAEVVFSGRDDREEVCARLQRERGLTLIHPFENPHVVAGAGTAALELLEDVPELDVVIAPIGGGGLMAGSTLSAGALAPDAQLLGAEPDAVDDACRSLASGSRQPGVQGARTWADGLMAGIGELSFGVLRAAGVGVVTVSEDEMLRAARTLLEILKLVVEPSAAVVLAALRRRATDLEDKRIGAILSGGNTDFRWLAH